MRKFIIIILGLLLLPLIAIAAIMIILSSDLPREITEKRLSEELGTEVTIKRQETRWSGRSYLAGVRIEIPEIENGIVKIESAQVRHNSILKLLVKGTQARQIEANGISMSLSQNDQQIDLLNGAQSNVKIYRNDDNVIKFTAQVPYWGQVEGLVCLEDNQINIERVEGQVLGGDLHAKGVLDPNEWQQISLSASWEKVNFKKLEKWLPAANRFPESVSGEIELKPTDDEHPLEPLEFTGKIGFAESVYDELKIEDLRFSGAIGKDRLLITDLRAGILGGNLQGRFKISQKGNGAAIYTNFTFNDIDINRAANVFSEDESRVVGRLNARGFLMMSGDLAKMNGEINLNLRESNLADSKIIGTLYDSLKLKFGRANPEGKGDAKLRLVGARLDIADFYYYNRGVELQGTGEVKDVKKGSESEIKGIVLATTRPFKQIDLPGVKTLDKFLLLVQEDISAVQVGGTLSQVKVKVITLPEIRDTLQKFFGGTQSN